MFEIMLDEIDIETVRILFSIKFASEEVIEGLKKENKDEIVLEKPEPLINNPEEGEKSVNEYQDPSPATVTREEPKLGRNEIVKITNGSETREMKYKKARSLIESGEWKII